MRVKANAYDTEACGSSGCSPDLTRDSDSKDDNSRWSCHNDLNIGRNCKLWYRFRDPQNVRSVELAFYEGDQQPRSSKVRTIDSNNNRIKEILTSSGTTDGFEAFEVVRDDVVKPNIQFIPLCSDDWVGVKEVTNQCVKSRSNYHSCLTQRLLDVMILYLGIGTPEHLLPQLPGFL